MTLMAMRVSCAEHSQFTKAFFSTQNQDAGTIYTPVIFNYTLLNILVATISSDGGRRLRKQQHFLPRQKGVHTC